MHKIPYKLIVLFICICTLTGCYRMPTEEDYCLIPSTNNSSLTNESPNNFMPSVGY